jgi:hypothetical protein
MWLGTGGAAATLTNHVGPPVRATSTNLLLCNPAASVFFPLF